jgi:hypothetical protein
MHRHECNTHIEPIYFYSENQTMIFSYTKFLVNKINVEKVFKIMRKLLFNYSFYSHPEIGKFQGVTVSPGREDSGALPPASTDPGWTSATARG